MQLFNRDGDGGAEISATLGLIASDVDFPTWEPILPLGTRDVAAIVGREPVEALSAFYLSGTPDPELTPALHFLQQAVALFTWLKIIPTLDAQHDSHGRTRRIGENEKGLTALEQYKDEENIRRLAYEATDALIETLDRAKFDFWLESPKYKIRAGLIIRSKEEFDEYYTIGSHRLFVTLLPVIREVQYAYVRPLLRLENFQALLNGDPQAVTLFKEAAARAVALLTIRAAVLRLPVEVLPEGIVQVNQSAPVTQRLRAEKSARESVAASLADDAAASLQQLEDAMAELSAGDSEPSYYLPRPLNHSKGMSF